MNYEHLHSNIWLREFKMSYESTIKDVRDLYERPIFRLAKRIVKDEKVAEDIVAETFVKLWRDRLNFKGQPHIKSYLFLIAKNACLDYKKNIKCKNASYEELKYLQNVGVEEVMNRIIHGELIKIMSDEIEKLPELARKIFKLTFVEGLKPAEIALQLSMPTQNVRNNKSRALELLRLSLAKRDFMASMILLEIICIAVCQ